MKLQQVEIEGYRSIRERMVLFVEPSVTVVLGPNDHGKTNLLSALQHLNEDTPFDEDADLNWDCSDKADSLPRVAGRFALSKKEREWLLEKENLARREINDEIEIAKAAELVDAPAQIPLAPAVAARKTAEPVAPPDRKKMTLDAWGIDDLPDEPLPYLKMSDVPVEIVLQRVGVEGGLQCLDLDDFLPSAIQGFEQFLPRVELIAPITDLSDSVTADDLQRGKNEFMRGIFHYAGLNPDTASVLVKQTDRNQMAINRASETLNQTLRESWSQGKDLSFRLSHNSQHQTIELQIEDPSVRSTFVRASRRSSGFTHYFSLKTILYARQKDHPAESYILLFDEPGVFLHPSGQFDLLQVLETLGQESQVVYVTHSLFMINKTFPTRHRLLMKSDTGSVLDGKPYVGRWQGVLTALGLALTGSILFANHVVLTEGDSDPIYLYAIIQKAVASNKCRLDLASLAILSTSESKHADVILRLLQECKPQPKVVVINDGDKGGKDRLRYLNAMVKEFQIPEKQLQPGTAIEDYLPHLRDVWVPAVASYVTKLLLLEQKTKPDETELEKKFLEHFDNAIDTAKPVSGMSEWAAEAAREVAGIEGKPSKVGIAREYATRLLAVPDKDFRWDPRTRALIEWIRDKASVPRLEPVKTKILDE